MDILTFGYESCPYVVIAHQRLMIREWHQSMLNAAKIVDFYVASLRRIELLFITPIRYGIMAPRLISVE